jgi:uncharacterized membrane protein YedE/YeeE
MGLCVVALYALVNQRLGVTSAYVGVLTAVRNRPAAEMWRVWFFVGLFGGALFASLLRGGPDWNLGYGALGALVPLALLIPILFISGVLVGFGGRWGGGCTAGHGLSGSASLSPGSIVATITFMATAILVTLGLHVLTGGLL